MSQLYGYKQRNAAFIDHNGNYGEYTFLEDPASTLYGKQTQTPPLPVPPLENSLAVFLKSAKPHVTEEEYEKTKKCVEEMLAPNSLARDLHVRLLKRAEESRKRNTSWFIDWWNQWAYLAYRDSVVHNVTYELLLKDECEYQMRLPTRRAARFCFYALQYRAMVVNGTLTPDMDAKTGLPWENSQHKYIFNCTRIPKEGSDISRTYAPDLFPHLVVCRKNNFYKFDALKNARTGEPLSVDEIQIQLDRIVKMADARGTDSNPVGILSAEDRDVWAKARVTLLSTGDAKLNETTLDAISSSMFIVCLDDESPVSRRDVARHMLHGGRGTNRFWDKSFQLVVTANGKMAYTGEHSMTDGMTTTRFVNFVLDKLFKDPESAQAPSKIQPVGKGPYASGSTSPLPEPDYLAWGLSRETILDIKRAEATFTEMSASKEFEVLMFYGFGAEKIKTFGCSPDAFAQMALQLAYRKTFGYCRGTYESTQTRTYMHGRTEVTRSVSNESERFCDAVLASRPREEIYQRLVEACKAHSEYTAKASKAMGCDRHLLALKFLLKENEKAPALYSDPGYTRSNHWAISTSGLAGELMDGWCFGEVVPDGIGVGYSVQQRRLRYSITSRHPQEKWAQRVCQNLEYALTLMGSVCEQSSAPPARSSSEAKQPKSKL